MSLIDTIKSKLGLSEKSFTIDDTDYTTNWGRITRLNSPTDQLRFYVDWVYACVQSQARLTAEINFRLLQRRRTSNSVRDFRGKSFQDINPEDAREIDSNLALEVLDCPNDYLDKTELIELMVIHYKLTGNAYLIVDRNGVGGINLLYPLDPRYTRVLTNNLGLPTGYETTMGQTRFKPPNEDIIHIKSPHPTKFYTGMGVIEASSYPLQLDEMSAEHDLRFAKNAPWLGGFLKLPKIKRFDDKAKKRLLTKWRKKYVGTKNAGTVAVLDENIEFQTNSLKKTEILSLEQRKLNREQILAMFTTSASILGIDSSPNRATAEVAEYSYIKNVIKPNMAKLVNALNTQLIPQYDESLFLSFDNPVPEDKEFDLKRKQGLVDKTLTRNEVRELDGLPPKEGGDVLYQPAGDVPLGTNILEEIEPPAEVNPEPDPPQPEPDPDDEPDDEADDDDSED